jgi:hypothetical protein
MPAFGRHDDLLRQIPDDVKARAKKAGVTEVDWYAGRLTSSGKKGFTELPPSRYEELRGAAKARRRHARKERGEAVRMQISAALARVWSAPRRLLTRHVS